MNHNKLECFYCKFLKEKALLELQAQLVKPFKNHWGKKYKFNEKYFFCKKRLLLEHISCPSWKIYYKKEIIGKYGQKKIVFIIIRVHFQ